MYARFEMKGYLKLKLQFIKTASAQESGFSIIIAIFIRFYNKTAMLPVILHHMQTKTKTPPKFSWGWGLGSHPSPLYQDQGKISSS